MALVTGASKGNGAAIAKSLAAAGAAVAVNYASDKEGTNRCLGDPRPRRQGGRDPRVAASELAAPSRSMALRHPMRCSAGGAGPLPIAVT